MDKEPSECSKKKTLHNTNCCGYGYCLLEKIMTGRNTYTSTFFLKNASTVQVSNASSLVEEGQSKKSVNYGSQSLILCEFFSCQRGAALLSMNRPKWKALAVPSRNLPRDQEIIVVTSAFRQSIIRRKILMLLFH